jgi:hypothetical protein
MSSESAGQMLRNFRSNLAIINYNRRTDYGLFLMDWNKMLWDENNLENDKPYFIEKTGYGIDAKAICLYKKGSDEYVILNKCLYDTKKDANGYRKEYWGNEIDYCIIWIVLDDAIKRYNDSIVRNILKSGEEYVASKERGLSVWIARRKSGNLYLFFEKPYITDNSQRWHIVKDYNHTTLVDTGIKIDKTKYPEITWENSPKEFELKAVEK